jgi:two-component system, LytTR family, response regulator
MKSLRTIVVDDEKPARTRLIGLLSRHDDVEIVGIARNGREAVALIRAEQPDLVFLDVQMPDLDGLAVVKEITPDRMPATIFITAFEQYALEAFELHAFGYVLKPFSDERVEAALTHVRKFIVEPADRGADHVAPEELPAPGKQHLERIVLRSPGRVSFLPVDDIDWIEACGVYVNLHVGTKQFLYRSSIANLLQRLNPERFVRIHRSAAVNTSRVRELHPRSHGDYTLVLKDGRELLLSRAHRAGLEGWLRQRL